MQLKHGYLVFFEPLLSAGVVDLSLLSAAFASARKRRFEEISEVFRGGTLPLAAAASALSQNHA
jgi:hypothetical protein